MLICSDNVYVNAVPDGTQYIYNDGSFNVDTQGKTYFDFRLFNVFPCDIKGNKVYNRNITSVNIKLYDSNGSILQSHSGVRADGNYTVQYWGNLNLQPYYRALVQITDSDYNRERTDFYLRINQTPMPLVEPVDIRGYNYYDGNKTYWFSGNRNFSIESRGYRTPDYWGGIRDDQVPLIINRINFTSRDGLLYDGNYDWYGGAYFETRKGFEGTGFTFDGGYNLSTTTQKSNNIHAWKLIANGTTKGDVNMLFHVRNRASVRVPDFELKHIFGNSMYIDQDSDLHGIKMGIDTTAPSISNIRINYTDYGYDVFADIIDNGSGVGRVQFPTWSHQNGQDDIQNDWGNNPAASGTHIGGNTYKYSVRTSDHLNNRGGYSTHIYAYDKVGNSSGSGIELLNSINLDINFIKHTPNVTEITANTVHLANTNFFYVKANINFNLNMRGGLNFTDQYHKINGLFGLITPSGNSNYNTFKAFNSLISNIENTSTNIHSGHNNYPSSSMQLITAGSSISRMGNEVNTKFISKIINNGESNRVTPLYRIDNPSINKESNWDINQNYIFITADGIAPRANSITTTPNNAFEYKIRLNNITDNLSGVRDSSVKVAVWKDGENYREWYNMQRITGTNDFIVTVNLNEKQHIGKFGNFKIEVTASDNVSNEGVASSSNFQHNNPTPFNGSLIVKKSDFKESENVHWVKPNSIFEIETNGYFPSNYGLYPSRTYLLFAKDGAINSNSARQYATVNEKVIYGTEFNNYFNFLNDGGKATKSQINSKNYLTHLHKLSAKLDNTKFKLNHTITYMVDREYSPGYLDSGIWLKVDGVAPNGTPIVSFDNLNLDIDVSVRNVIETGSGIKEIYVNAYPVDKINIAKRINLTNQNGEWKTKFNAYDLFKSDNIQVDIIAADNVGNSRTLKSITQDLFTLRASIVPYNNKDFIGTPSLLRGQKALLKIITTGGADQIEIEFPDHLVQLDPTLNKSFNLTPQKYVISEIPFYVPLYSDTNNYKVTVKAHKSLTSSIKHSIPDFNVGGSILDNIRTRRRDKE